MRCFGGCPPQPEGLHLTVRAPVPCPPSTPLNRFARVSHTKGLPDNVREVGPQLPLGREPLRNSLMIEWPRAFTQNCSDTVSCSENKGQEHEGPGWRPLPSRSPHFAGHSVRELSHIGSTPRHPAVVPRDADGSLIVRPEAQSGSSISWKAEPLETQPASCSFSTDRQKKKKKNSSNNC